MEQEQREASLAADPAHKTAAGFDKNWLPVGHHWGLAR
jgi:hypothetical protein